MNKNSLIVKFITENPRNWKEIFKKKGIHISEDSSLMLFKYGIDCDFSDPIVQEARGIIIDMSTFEVVCWPFNKFGNYGESYVPELDWSSAEVQEKIDGSIVKLYWYKDGWYWATNGVINAAKAEVQNFNKSYFDLISSAKNYLEIFQNDLNKDYTYIFELVSPYNRVVVEYNFVELYHIGTRNNVTGEELNIDLGIQKPARYQLHSLEDCLAAAQALCNDGQVREGFVVVDKNWNRVKIKTPEYLAQHHAWGNGSYLMNKATAVMMALDMNNEAWKDFQSAHHAYMSQVRWYQYQIELLGWEIDRFLIMVRAMYQEYSYERKPVANAIKNHRLSYFGFKGIDNKLTSNELIAQMPVEKLAKFLPDYVLPPFIEDLSFGLKTPK